VSLRERGGCVHSDARACELTPHGATLGVATGRSQTRASEFTNAHQLHSDVLRAASRARDPVELGFADPRKMGAPRVGSRQYKDKSPRAPTRARGEAQRGAFQPNRARVARVAVLPKHVQHCYESGARDWWIYIWSKIKPSQKTRVPYRCNSWRCPVCARHEAAVTFARIRDATAPFDAQGFVFLVLTLDRNGYYSNQVWRDATDAYKALGKMSERFLKRLRRWMERGGMTPFGSEWIAVVEAHRSGWPHMNLMIYAPELAEFLANENAERARIGLSSRECTLLPIEIADAAVSAGWGRQSTGERVRDRNAVAGYITKLAGNADASGAEVAKITQAPLSAPNRFRRLRAGKKFLPPRRKNPNATGTLVRRTTFQGTAHVVPLHRASPELQADIAVCCEIEETIMVREHENARALREWNRAARAVWPAAVIKDSTVSVWFAPALACRAPPDLAK